MYAVDIEPRQLDALRNRIADAQLNNIVPVLASYSTPHLPPSHLDLVLVVDTYHHLGNRVDYFRQLRAMLRAGGRLAILEYKSGGTAHWTTCRTKNYLRDVAQKNFRRPVTAC